MYKLLYVVVMLVDIVSETVDCWLCLQRVCFVLLAILLNLSSVTVDCFVVCKVV